MKNKPTFILLSIFIILSIVIAGVKILVSNTNNLYDDSGIIFIDLSLLYNNALAPPINSNAPP